jgi:AMMECR1 domain-containing protein
MPTPTAEREALRELLSCHGILWSSSTEVIRGRNGTPAPWAFYSWGVSLTAEGLRLAAICLLDRLRTFRATQLASIGYTGLPLLSACLLLGEGCYTGLCVRDKRKPYLSGRRVEGVFDHTRPVIIIDDSLSSGTSLHAAIRAIEEEGGTVEGAVALTHFPGRGGLEWANAAGYRTEVLFDIWTDLGMSATVPGPPPAAPIAWETSPAPDGLHPAYLARLTARHWLETGLAPLPPRTLDADYDPTGGVFVSFRTRNGDRRLARDGFWHFPGEASDAGAGVIRATVKTLFHAGGVIDGTNLNALKIAVTFLGPLELVGVAGLDFDRYGIVVSSRRFPAKMGGALPNTQVFISEIEQLRHASRVNARLDSTEPFDLFRHDIVKCVEPGADWLPYGQQDGPATTWWRNAALGAHLAGNARSALAALRRGENPSTSDIAGLPCPIGGVAVRIYRNGLRGYGLSLGSGFAESLAAAAMEAARDPRLATEEPSLESCTVVLSILHHPERLGAAHRATVAEKLRRGLDALEVATWSGRHVLLPSALTYNSWSRQNFVALAARIAGGAGHWTTWQVAEWAALGDTVRPLRFGFPDRTDTECDIATAIADLAVYIDTSLDQNLIPCYALDPMTGNVERGGTAARVIHALTALDMAGAQLGRADWRERACGGLAHCLHHAPGGSLALPGFLGGAMAECVLLAGISANADLAASPPAQDLAQRVQSLFQPDGRIGTGVKVLNRADDHDYLPGVALWALAGFALATGIDLLPADLESCVEWYSHRFRAVPHWGMAGWQPQGWEAVHRARGTCAGRKLAFAVADWAIERQLSRSGAFLETLSPHEPSFNTGFIAEGIAAAWALAVAYGETERAHRYKSSWRNAARFMNRLIIHPEDTFGMAAGASAIGGVRCMLTRSDVRIDQVSHWLHALLVGAPLARDAGVISAIAVGGAAAAQCNF